MLINKAVNREWKDEAYAGVARSLFRNNDAGGRSSVVRMKQAARVRSEEHTSELQSR